MRRSDFARLALIPLLPALIGASPVWQVARDGAKGLWPAAAQRTTIRLVYEGATGGSSSPYSDLAIDARVAAALPDGFARLGGGFGALLGDDGWLLSPHAVRSFDALAGAPLPLGDAQPTQLLLGDDWAIVAWPPEAAASLLPTLAAVLGQDLHRPEPELIPTTARSGPDGLLHIGDQAPGGPFDPRDHEIRLRAVHEGLVDGQPARVHVIARSRGEGARRATVVRERTDDGTFYIAGGDSIEGRSFLAGRTLSLQREVTWQTWKTLGLDVLVPSTAELLAGVDGLRAEAAAVGVTLVSSTLTDADGAPVFAPWTVLRRGGRTLLVLGWTPPGALAPLAPALKNGLLIRGEDSLNAVLAEALASLDAPPDLVVLAGVGGDGLGGRIRGIDIVLTDFGGDQRLGRTVTSDLTHLAARQGVRRTTRDAAIIGHLGPRLLGRVDIAFGPDGALVELSHVAEPIGEELRPDPVVRRAVQVVRQTIYADREDILVPDPTALVVPRGWRRVPVPPTMDEAAFAALAGNLLTDRTGADVALLRPLPSVLRLPGPRPALLVDSSLTVLDEVIVVDLLGKELKAILKALVVAEPTAGQAQPRDGWVVGGALAGIALLVGGRKVDDGDVIRVATTEFFTEDPRVARLFSLAATHTRFAGKGWRRIAAPRGQTWPLRDLVRDGLEALRGGDPTFGAGYSRHMVPLLTRDARWITPQLTLALDDIALGLTGSLGLRPDTGYATSNESRATLKDSFATSLRGRIALSWSDRFGEILGFGEGSFARSQEEDAEEPIELSDDLVVGVETKVRIRAVRGRSGASLPLSAFLQGAFDTEFTRTDDPSVAASKLPRQQLLRATGGVTLGRMGALKEARVGFFVEADLAAEEGTFSPGFSAGLMTEKRWGPVKWSNDLDFRGYLPTPLDTEADLSIRFDVRSELSVLPLRKILPGLAVGGFVDALLFRGQIEGVNTIPGLHMLLGAQLSYDTELRPPIRLR